MEIARHYRFHLETDGLGLCIGVMKVESVDVVMRCHAGWHRR
jgi:hypothetical protein